MFYGLSNFKEGRERDLFKKLITSGESIEVWAYSLAFDQSELLKFNKSGRRFVKPFHGMLFEFEGFRERCGSDSVCSPYIKELKKGKLLSKEIFVFNNNGVHLKVFDSEEEMLTSFKKNLIEYEKARDSFFEKIDDFIVSLKQSLKESC